MTRDGPRRARPRLLGAVAASLVLHALVLVLVARVEPPPPPPREGSDLPVELVPAPAAAPPPAPALAPPSQGRPRPGTGRVEGSPPPAPRAPAAAGAEPRAGPPDAAVVDRWFEQKGLGPGERPRRPPEPGSDPLAVAPPRELLEEAQRAGEEERDPAKRAKRRIDDMLAELKARDLARYPDASWMELRDGLADGFSPSPDLLRGGGGKSSGALGAIGDAAGAYADTASRYARTGSPFDPGPSAPGEMAAGKAAVAAAGSEGDRDREALQAGVDRLQASAAPGAGGQPWSRGLLAVVELEQDEKGVVTHVRVVGRSGNAAYDRLALEQAKKLVGRSLATRLAGTRTRWAIATELLVAPAAPAAGFSFDANFKPTGAAYPFARSTRTRVEIVSVRQGGG